MSGVARDNAFLALAMVRAIADDEGEINVQRDTCRLNRLETRLQRRYPGIEVVGVSIVKSLEPSPNYLNKSFAATGFARGFVAELRRAGIRQIRGAFLDYLWLPPSESWLLSGYFSNEYGLITNLITLALNEGDDPHLVAGGVLHIPWNHAIRRLLEEECREYPALLRAYKMSYVSIDEIKQIELYCSDRSIKKKIAALGKDMDYSVGLLTATDRNAFLRLEARTLLERKALTKELFDGGHFPFRQGARKRRNGAPAPVGDAKKRKSVRTTGTKKTKSKKTKSKKRVWKNWRPKTTMTQASRSELQLRIISPTS